MRILLRLRCEKAQEIDNSGHKLQGFVYELVRRSGYSGLHEKKGYKFFCFSEIFPKRVGAAGDVLNFIVCSPSRVLIEGISRCLQHDECVKIGEMEFRIVDFFVFEVKIGNRVRLRTETPVIIRIPEANYERYGIPFEERKRRYVYWRPNYSFEAFLKQLSENLIKKYNDFYGTEIQNYDLFQEFVFRKQVNLRLVIDGRSYGAAGSMWDFMWSSMDSVQRKIIAFGIDSGFGERNTMGYGFVNRVGERDK
ncbi:MAG: CRISPR-associated endoribonuclease Cas6 [Thermoplasmata archaeon]